MLAGLALVLPLAALPAHAAVGPAWRVAGPLAETSQEGDARTVRPERAARWALDRGALAPALTGASGVRTVELPGPDGRLARFAVAPSAVMAPGLAAAHPDIRTFAGRGLDDPAATVRLDVGPLGLHASVRGPRGAWYVDPWFTRDRGVYASYFGRDLRVNPHGTFVESDGDGLAEATRELGPDAAPSVAGPAAAGLSVGSQLRTYRLALVTDPSYAAYFGRANVTAAKVALVNRIDQIYEDDLAIHLVLIDGTDRLNLDTDALATGPDGPCGAEACYTTSQLSTCTIPTLYRNAIVLGQLVGAGAYDIGHIALGKNGGGVAGLGVVGRTDKAVGCTGVPDPVGDYYAVDYVAHEMGHQFGGNHTFNGVERNCSGGNREAATSVEPGSGSSIMAYAGICGQDDLQPHSDPYFSQRSFTEIETYVSTPRKPQDEAQTVSLRRFDGSDAIALTYRGARTRPLVHGTSYSPAGISAALRALPTWPAGGTVSVSAFAGGDRPFGDTGFRLTFGGSLAGKDVTPVGLVQLSGSAGGFVGETFQGGPAANQGHTVTATGNAAPVVSTPTRYVIPRRTPFTLLGSATDADGDPVTYLWEQNDRGAAQGTALLDPAKRNGPLFTQFGTPLDGAAYEPGTYSSPGENAATTDPSRTFPNLVQVLNGNTNAATGDCPGAPAPPGGAVPPLLVTCYSEFLPTAAYTGLPGSAGPAELHFRLTARDGSPGGAGVAHADTTVQLTADDSPFLVTSQATGRSYPALSDQDVTWRVAGTAAAPVGVSRVRITLSRDGGLTWPVVLAEAAPNTGSAAVRLPAGSTSRARIRVEAVGNIFFSVNAAEFAITG